MRATDAAGVLRVSFRTMFVNIEWRDFGGSVTMVH